MADTKISALPAAASAAGTDTIPVAKGGSTQRITVDQIKTFIGVTGVNTGDQDLSTLVPKTTQVNGHPLSTSVTVTKADVGLGSVDNTSDAGKPVSTATATALSGKQDTLVSGTNIKTINSTSILGSGNIVISGGGGGSIYKNAVVDYGAVGDGVTNNATAFTNFATALPGYIGYIPAGKFLTNGTSGVGAIHLSYSTGGQFAYDTSPVASLMGAGPQNTIIIPNTVGMYGVHATSNPAASIMEVTYKDFTISGRGHIGTVNGMYLEVVEMMTLENLRFEQLNTGIYANSVEYATFNKCFFESNVNGMIAELGVGGFTHLNACSFIDCYVDRNTANGIKIVDNAATTQFIGGSVANNGTMGVGGTAGLNITCSGAEGANGVTISNVYFEGNKGDADIKINNTGSSYLVHTIQGCNFNRVGNTEYTTHNITATGKNVILLIGCSFSGYGGYVPNSGRSYISGDANTIFVPIGCTWNSSTEANGLPSMSNKGVYYGSVAISGGSVNVGASNIPQGMTVTYNSVGNYTINHNLNSATPILMTQILDPGFVSTSYIIGVTSNSISVGMRNASNAYVDCSFMFTLQAAQVSV